MLTSTVGFPLESRISLAFTFEIADMSSELDVLKVERVPKVFVVKEDALPTQNI